MADNLSDFQFRTFAAAFERSHFRTLPAIFTSRVHLGSSHFAKSLSKRRHGLSRAPFLFRFGAFVADAAAADAAERPKTNRENRRR